MESQNLKDSKESRSPSLLNGLVGFKKKKNQLIFSIRPACSLFLDKRQPDGVEGNQETSFVLSTLQLSFGLSCLRLEELMEV